jgi:hypothetical protein
LCHLGYEPAKTDVREERLLHRALGPPVPEPYRRHV